jgi:hypothetical protein
LKAHMQRTAHIDDAELQQQQDQETKGKFQEALADLGVSYSTVHTPTPEYSRIVHCA